MRVIPAPGADTSAAELVLSARSVRAESFDPVSISGGATPVSGQLCAQAVGLRKGQLVTGIGVRCTGAGTAVTLFKVGLYDKNGVLLASSVDQKAILAVGFLAVAFSAGYTILTDDLYYLALIATTGTTNPSFAAGGGSYVEPFGQIVGGLRRTILQTGLGDLPSTITPANGVNPYWCAALP